MAVQNAAVGYEAARSERQPHTTESVREQRRLGGAPFELG